MEESWFQPISKALLAWKEELSDEQLGAKIQAHTSLSFPENQGATIALIGVPEQRGSGNPREIDLVEVRKALYTLVHGNWGIEVIDLGDLNTGAELSDTYAALESCLTDLMKAEVIPVVIGGSHDLTVPMYTAYRKMEQTVNLAVVDRKVDLLRLQDKPSADNFLGNILLEQPNILFNYSQLAHQSYYVPADTENVLTKMHFDFLRLGRLREDRTLIEPIMRDADLVSIDLESLRGFDMPAIHNPGPNGLSGDEVCAITRYAGISDKLTSFGIFGYQPENDSGTIGAQLIGQMIWYFIEGVALRKADYPFTSKSEYQKFTVANEKEADLIFYKSPKSGRWWMEVPFPENALSKYKRHALVPCSYEDYLRAVEGEIPDRWWLAMHKLI